MITVLNYAALKTTATSNGSAFVRGKSISGDGGEGAFIWVTPSTETANEATIIESTVDPSGRWERVIEEKVNVQWFGAVPDCYKGNSNYTIVPTGTDSTDELQAAIDFCITYGYDLYMPAGKVNASKIYGEYLVSNTLNITAPLNIYAEVNAAVTGFIIDKTKPVFLIKDCNQGKIENLTIQGCGYLPLAGIQFSAALGTNEDSQGMELNNVKIYNCRHGVYSAGVETINRMVFNRCVFVSNLIAGFYLKSFIGQQSQSLGSGPITFIHTIMNGNGIPNWMTTAQKYQNVQILGSTDLYGYQMYAQGFCNLSYIGGQLSAHGDPKLLSLATIEDGFGVNFMGVDIEDINFPVDETGARISNYNLDYGSIAGAALLVRNVRGYNFTQSHFFNIKTQTVFRFVDKCGDVNIQVADLESENTNRGNFKYSVDCQASNWQTNEPLTRITYTGAKDKFSTFALNALDKSGMQVLSSVKGLFLPTTALDNIFTYKNKNAANTKYVIKYKGASGFINPANACCIEKDISNCTLLHVILECTQNVFNPDGKFFIQELNGSTVLSEKLYDLQGAGLVGNSYHKYATFLPSSSATKLRYGFINNLDYSAEIPDNTTVKGFTVYADFKNPLQKIRSLDINF